MNRLFDIALASSMMAGALTLMYLGYSVFIWNKEMIFRAAIGLIVLSIAIMVSAIGYIKTDKR